MAAAPSEDSPAAVMTADEEAELLAQYGTTDTFFDELLDVQAPSNHRNLYNSSNLFLTSYESLANESAPAAAAPLRLDALDLTAPIELFVLRHLNTTGAGAALSLTEAVSYTVDSLHTMQQQQKPLSSSALDAINKITAEMETDLGITSQIRCPDDDDAFEKELEALLRAADFEIERRNFHYDPATDPVFQERLRQLQDREATPMHDEAFDDDAELLSAEELREIERNVDERPSAPVLLPEEVEALRYTDNRNEELRFKRVRNMAESKQKIADAAARGEIESTAIRSEISAMVQLRTAQIAQPPILPIETLLTSISRIEQRDSDLELSAVQSIRLQLQASEAAISTQEARRRKKREEASLQGKLALDDFVKKIDFLIEPPQSVVVDGEGRGQQGERTAVSTQAVKPQRESLQSIKRRSQRQELLARREAVEMRAMRDEDERIVAMERKREIVRIEREDQRTSLFTAEEVGRRGISGEEAVAHVEIVVREERQRAAVTQLVTQRQAQRQARLVSDVTQHYTAIREGIANMEECEFSDLLRVATLEREATLARAVALEETLRKFEKKLIAQAIEARHVLWTSLAANSRQSIVSLVKQRIIIDNFGDNFPNHYEVTAMRKAGLMDAYGFGARVSAAQFNAAARVEWNQAHKGLVVSALQALSIALHSAMNAKSSALLKKRKSATGKSAAGDVPARSASRTPSTPPPAQSADAGGDAVLEEDVPLDGKLVRKLLPLQFAAASCDAARTPQYFHTVSFTLESIGCIDFASLQDLCVIPWDTNDASSRQQGGLLQAFAEGGGVKVTPFVKSLDLSNNVIRSIALEKLMDCFPSLIHLRLGDNRLASLPAPAPSTGANGQSQGGRLTPTTPLAAVSSTQFPTISLVDLSANKLDDICGIGSFPELRTLLAYSNSLVSLTSLRGCTKLRELELSRNRVECLDGLEALATLGTLDLSRNKLTSWDLKSNILLQKLFLSSNQLSAFPTSVPLVFLRQLFLNENKLTEVPDGLMWLPLLSDLHLESNQLRSVKGLSNCVQLTVLKLAFNLIQDTEDLLVLAPCKKMQSFSYNDNPSLLATPYTAAEAERAVICMFPLLRELNSEVLSDDRKKKALATHIATESSFLCAMATLFETHSKTRIFPGRATFSSDALRQFFAFSSYFYASHSVSSMTEQQELVKKRTALAADAALDRLQTEYNAVYVASHRKLQTALAVEENLRTRTKERGGYILPSLFYQSTAIAERNYVEGLQQSQRHLEQLKESLNADNLFNVHSNSVAYELRARAHREAKAKKKLSEWICGRMMIQKAQAELEVLREASEVGKMRRYLKAALKIQPLWRGAITRLRLRKARLPDDDDDFVFQKVTFEQPEGPIGFSNFSSILQGAFMSHPQAPQFQIKSVQKEVTSARVGSAPGLQGAATVGGALNRPQSNPTNLTKSSDDGAMEMNAKSARTTLDDEWGSALAEQLRKKNKKMEKAKQDFIRREFQNDPLRAKRLQAGK